MSTTDPVVEIPARLLEPAETFSFEGEYTKPSLTIGPDTYTFARQLSYQIFANNTGDGIVFAGSISGTGTTECMRCLEDFDLEINGEIENFLVTDPSKPLPDDLEADEYLELPESHIVDLVPMLDAAIILDLPLRPLCRDDCRGICPDCGANLNEGDCECAKRRAEQDEADRMKNNPFSVLADLDL